MNKAFRRILIVLIVLNIAFIWGNSLMPAEVSTAISDFVKQFLGVLDTVKKVRKSAHFTEFAFLAVWLELYFYDNIEKNLLKIAYAGFTVAFIDETIQLFVRGRTGQIVDVWVDIAGVATGMAVTYIAVSLIKYIRFRKKKHRKSE